MPWHIHFPLFHEPSEEEWEYHRELRRAMWRASKTRDGKLILAEAFLFVVAAGAMLWLIRDWLKTGSLQSLFVAGLLSAMSFWPFLRHRLRHGDWPQ